jgi:GNAT superfamily N-acetyltransferase
VSRRLVNLTLDNLADLSPECRGCVFWELDPIGGERAQAAGSTHLEKEAWLSDTLLEWGSCGQVLYVDAMPAGHALYAPAAYVPRATAFPTSPISPDAILLLTARVAPQFRGGGLGRMLLQGVARDVVRRGIKAIEAFGRLGTDPDGDGGHSCLLPAEFLLAVGFKTVRAHPRTPRLRLDVKSLVTWREDVESALERLLGSMQVPSLSPR